jgi:outer membrane immunogenic protein
MKRFLLTVSAILLAAPAFAGEINSTVNWTGCYVGGNIGGAWGEVDPGLSNKAQHPNGFAGGGQIGCDYQFQPNWVIGLQGDFTGSAARDSSHYMISGNFDTFETNIHWLASATARLGYTSGPWLLYGKGGAAWISARFQRTDLFFATFVNTDTATHSGWTAGGGVEYALAPNWSVVLPNQCVKS